MRTALILCLFVIACDSAPVEPAYTPLLERVASEERAPEESCFDWGVVGCPCIHGTCFEGRCEGVAYDDDGYIEDYGMCVEDPQLSEPKFSS